MGLETKFVILAWTSKFSQASEYSSMPIFLKSLNGHEKAIIQDETSYLISMFS